MTRVNRQVNFDVTEDYKIRFTCTSLGCKEDQGNCTHLLETFEKREESGLILSALSNLGRENVQMDVLLLDRPHLWVPVWLVNDGYVQSHGIVSVKFPMRYWNPHLDTKTSRMHLFNTARLKPDGEQLCEISEGDGVASIMSVLLDVFKGEYMRYGLAPFCRCTNRSHTTKTQEQLDAKLRMKGTTKIKELLRLYVTKSCTFCTGKKFDMSKFTPAI